MRVGVLAGLVSVVGSMMVGMGHRGHGKSKGSKQHAQLRDEPPRLRPLWVYDADDWAEMMALPSGSLVCPDPACRSPFQVPQENSQGTRFLKDRQGSKCAHVFAQPEKGGGPVSAEHRWVQARIAKICDALGYRAIPEHYPSYADVYLPDLDFAIEYQRWKTDVSKRDAARRSVGAKHVLWLFPPYVNDKKSCGFLFGSSCARIEVVDMHTRRPVEPWKYPEQSRTARLYIYGTVARSVEGEGLRTGRHDAMTFLGEVLSGDRLWYKPGTRGLPSARKGGVGSSG